MVAERLIVLVGVHGDGQVAADGRVAGHRLVRQKIKHLAGLEDPHQCRERRLSPHVKPGGGPTDDHALAIRRALEDREADGGAASFLR